MRAVLSALMSLQTEQRLEPDHTPGLVPSGLMCELGSSDFESTGLKELRPWEAGRHGVRDLMLVAYATMDKPDSMLCCPGM